MSREQRLEAALEEVIRIRREHPAPNGYEVAMELAAMKGLREAAALREQEAPKHADVCGATNCWEPAVADYEDDDGKGCRVCARHAQEWGVGEQEATPPEPVCCCCGAPIDHQEAIEVGEVWEGRMNGYCYGCALARCDTADSVCPSSRPASAPQREPEPTFQTVITEKGRRHQEHYRSCGCLDDSAECCDPTCCPQGEGNTDE